MTDKLYLMSIWCKLNWRYCKMWESHNISIHCVNNFVIFLKWDWNEIYLKHLKIYWVMTWPILSNSIGVIFKYYIQDSTRVAMLPLCNTLRSSVWKWHWKGHKSYILNLHLNLRLISHFLKHNVTQMITPSRRIAQWLYMHSWLNHATNVMY